MKPSSSTMEMRQNGEEGEICGRGLELEVELGVRTLDVDGRETNE